MKITHVCLSLGAGGAERILVDTLPIYKNMGHDVSIIQLSSKLQEEKYIQEMNKHHIPIYTLSNKGFFSLFFLFKLNKIIKENKFDIVHVHLFPCFYYVAILALLGKVKTKLVFTEHSVQNGRNQNFLFRIIEPLIYKQYHGITAISKNVEVMLMNYLPKLKDKIHLINNGVNIRRFEEAIPYKRAEFLKQFSIPEDQKLIMMTSRFSEPKNQETLIRAMEYLPSNYFLILVGDGPNKEYCKEIADPFKERVKFLGFRMDIPELMKMADINILSSKHEGFSCVALEGLSCQRPFLGSDVSAINNLVPNSNFLFEEGNSKELALKIKNILECDEVSNNMVNVSKNHIKQYDVNLTIQNHISLYNKLLNKNDDASNV